MGVTYAVPQKFTVSFMFKEICVMGSDNHVLVYQTRLQVVSFSRTPSIITAMQGAFDVSHPPVTFQFVVIQDFFEQESTGCNFAQVKDGLPR